jgi:small subunit ribosomal protein S14
VRAQAALDLTRMNGDTRMTRIVNRCALSGRGRSVLAHFKYSGYLVVVNGRMNRMMFRNAVRAGDLPGVQKASW